MRRAIMVAAVLLSGMGAAFAQDAQTPLGAPPADTQSPPAAAQTPPADTQAPPAAPAPLANPVMTGPRILISTSMGDITLQLDAVRAPKSTANILRYVKNRHYVGTVVYRVVKDFVIQMGSWDANVKGRAGLSLVDFEGDNGLHNLRGTVAYAHDDDPRSGADFFINLTDDLGLDHTADKVGFAVFGEVASGMDVVDQIAAVPVGDHGPMPGSAPVDPIVIKKVAVLP